MNKQIIAVILSLVTLTAAVLGISWKFETKDDHDFSVESHDKNIEAHDKLFTQWAAVVVAEVEKAHHK